MKKAAFLFTLLSFLSCTKNNSSEFSSLAPCPTTNVFEEKDVKTAAERYIFVLNNAFESILPQQYVSRQKALDTYLNQLLPNSLLNQLEITNLYTEVFQGFAAKGNSEAISALSNLPFFSQIEPDQGIHLFQTCFSPPTSLTKQTPSWGANRIGIKSGEGKRAWVFDTGIDPNHPDLQVNEILSRDFSDGTLLPSNISSLSNWHDVNGHGTHVAGIIGAKNNDFGTVGIASNCDLVAIKVLNNEGQGNASDLIEAIDYVTSVALPGEVANMSLGGSTSLLVDFAVRQLASKNILISIAAGNSSDDASNYSPARVEHENVYTISAFSKDDVYSYFSNYGNPPIDFSQPGNNIISTWPGNTYILASGTSMAAPHFAGLLLTNGKNFSVDGIVKNDPDGNADLIAIQGN